MSLNAAIQIGRSALTASQVGIQVAGNNMANAATPGYSRQVAMFRSFSGDGSSLGVSIGRGVYTQAVRRQIDEALQARMYLGVADESAARFRSSVYSTIESTIGELSDRDLSSELSSFFNAWSERANLTRSNAAVVQQGDKLAAAMRRQRGFLDQQREQIDRQIGAAAVQADGLLSTIAELNRQIASAEVGEAQANTLRDTRDQAVAQLAELMDVQVIDRGREGVDVLVGSTPLVYGSTSRGLDVRRETVDGSIRVVMSTKTPPEEITPASGALGAMLAERTRGVDEAIQSLDRLTSQLIHRVNRLHSTGANAAGLTESTATLKVAQADRGRAFNDTLNQTMRGLPFEAENGGFTVRVKDSSGGAARLVRVPVDLDGITNAGTPGTGDDTTPEQVRLAINAIDGLTATWTSDGRLSVRASPGFEFSFEDDSSGALAVLGVNAYFTGKDATDVGVRADLVEDPGRLMTGRYTDGNFVENATALRLAGLADEALTSLGGRSLQQFWQDRVQTIGVRASTANAEAQATATVRQSLESQRLALSGVSMDEESINLLAFQRQYQGAAKLISVADALMDQLFRLV
ncbi:MAG: flagellar hook-associated protein FlgK [Phycisphaeraceae bacterium]|nr:MAG: flagellar hook-associated protein FlgK [Phycisphaeraceae bacterium]